MKKSNEHIPFVYFGTPDFSVDILRIMHDNDVTPDLVVTAPDKPRGRGQKVSAPPVGVWAKEHTIPFIQPEKITVDIIQEIADMAPAGGWELFVVVAYGHILPTDLIYSTNHNTLNLHPSLLPRLRGPAPIREAILQENETGVSIIELDEKMDHGPIVAQQLVKMDEWPPAYPDLKKKLTETGANLLSRTIPDWVTGQIKALPQSHEDATYSRKFSSDDGKIDFDDSPNTNIRRIRAFTSWPKAHYIVDGNRVIITKAHLSKGELVIDRVKPAGKEEMTYTEFTRT